MAAGTDSFQVVLHSVIPGNTDATIGSVVNVDPASGAVFAVPFSTYPAIPGGNFGGTSDLIAGQEILLQLSSSSGASTVASSRIYLEPSQTVGAVQSVADSSFVLSGLTGLWTATRPVVNQIDCQVGQTTYENLSSSSLGSLAPGSLVAVKGLLLNTAEVRA